MAWVTDPELRERIATVLQTLLQYTHSRTTPT